MAFDSQTRNKLQRMVGACRPLLTDEFDDQLQGLYGIYAQDGRVLELEKLTTLDDDDYQIATLLRDRVKHLTSGMASEKQPLAEAVRRVLREQAFTLLNRFAALRMAEERGFVQECVGQGLKSKGFQVFETVARSGLGGAYERYVTFIHGMFDELSLDLGVLFDRWSPFGLLFPREPALLKFFELLNDPELKPLWKEDETIGWIYQYFNGNDVKEMREAANGGAPRNSRELAVRNQFFTPRYVVEFLTDNTLGRIWYEMTRSETKLKQQCRYLVRRPNEIFLKPGETAPEQQTPPATASQEDLLKQPVHIPHRPIKDPRTILMLDPACGSMHFGLYAFDLFEVIYDEAWELEKLSGAEFQNRPPGMLSLQESYGTKEDFLKDVPRLIIEHNLHGIDIDPRCAQIAGLSLWLRAQKAWQRLGLKPAERPAIKRSNIVCAEPMPGEKELLREFVEREFPAEERGVCLRLLEAIFDKMQLAGEAGSLLKIEEEIRSAIEDARRQWQTARQRPEFFDADQLATLDKRTGAQQELPAAERASMATDLRSLTSEDFWERIEERIYAALRDYAEQAENGGGFQRRLFAEDAARGFAFIDVCRKRYDVALMNPPFGSSTEKAGEYLLIGYIKSFYDLAAAFYQMAFERMTHGGRLGAIANRTIHDSKRLSDFRKRLLQEKELASFIDLGSGVLDALVEAALTVNGNQAPLGETLFADCTQHEDKGSGLLSHVDASRPWLIRQQARFTSGNAELSYKADSSLDDLGKPIVESGFEVRQGLASGDNFRFVRLRWEVPNSEIAQRWFTYSKGGDYAPFYYDLHLVVDWGKNAQQTYRERTTQFSCLITKNSHKYAFRPGLTYATRTTSRLSVRVMHAGCLFDTKGSAIFSDSVRQVGDAPFDLIWLACALNSDLYQSIIDSRSGALDSAARSYSEGMIGSLPVRSVTPAEAESFVARGRSIIHRLQNAYTFQEPSALFVKAIVQRADGMERASSSLTESAVQLWNETQALQHDENLQRTLMGTSSAQAICEISDVVAQRYGAAVHENLVPEERQTVIAGVASYLAGCAFGRWDIRYAMGEKAAPELPDPFAPLPVCPPGQLQNAQGLPARPEDVPAAYPVRIPWDGILVEDPNHALDIERRVREVIEIIWKDRAEAIEHEACEILGVKSLRDYFRKPTGFFADHLKRYSKSRRQAPIYWPLSTASGNYTLWIYYHRLTDQTLFQCVNDFVKPKLEEVNRDIERLRGELQRADGGSSKQREKLQELEDLAIELKEFHDELLRVAGLPYKPNLNDGVLITASPLWKLFRLPKWQKDLKACWEALEGEEYEWAHLAYTIWPDRVKQVCKTDRSIAIAHGLEDLCEVKAPEKKAKRGKKKAEQMELEGGNE